jgi:hypothetical protein
MKGVSEREGEGGGRLESEEAGRAGGGGRKDGEAGGRGC